MVTHDSRVGPLQLWGWVYRTIDAILPRGFDVWVVGLAMPSIQPGLFQLQPGMRIA